MDHLASSFLGLGNGATYALLALALVLTYRSSGVLNFATGAQALYGAYTYSFLRQGQLFTIIPGVPKTIDLGGSLPWVPALLIACVISAGLGALLYVLVFRPMRKAPALAKAVASLGVLVVLQSLVSMRMGSLPVIVKAIYPSKPWTWQGQTVLSDRVYLALTVIALTFAITALYRWTRFGLDTRATAESETGAYVSGLSPDRIALLNWMLAGTVAGVAGILIAPLSPLTPSTYTLFVVPALAAAIVGEFKYLVPTALAGIGIGMIQAWLVFLSGKYSWMPQSGVGEIVPLVVMLVALLVTGRAVPERGSVQRPPLGRAPRPRSYTWPIVAGFVVGAVALVATTGSSRAAVINTLIFAVVALSLVVVTGYAGQVSLAQLALAGAGGFMLSYLTVDWGVPFPIAPLLAALATTVVGVLVGLPALRLRGLTLGVVTLALAFGIEAIWFRNTDLIDSFGNKVESPTLFGVDFGIGVGKEFPRLPFGFLCLGVVVVVAFGIARLRNSALGSAMLAVRANERSAAGIGVNVVYVKVVSFAIASFVAGLAGCLLAYRQGVITWESFAALAGLGFLSTAYLAGVTSVYGGINAGIIAAGGIVFFLLNEWFGLSGDWFVAISGVLVILTLMRNPEGLAAGGHELVHKVRAWRDRRRGAPPEPEAAAGPTTVTATVTRTPPAPDAPVVLEVDGLSVHYGGVTAVDGLSLRVPRGGIVGLIGPNGAGKTSAIDAITGFAKAEAAIVLDGQRIDRLKPHQRVRRGLARTFQALELYDDLTVEENVSAAAFGVRGEARHGAVQRALDLVGIAHLRDRHAEDLSQGQRQLVSIARACAADPHVVLLDEPAAGLDSTESRWLGERIRAISATGTGVLLVDHDVALVLDVCDYIYVLDFGRVIAQGSPGAIRTDRAVIDAYLGTVHGAGGSGTVTARLECDGLTGGYGTTVAFRDVDLALEAGTVEALLGPNGAGKTTLLITIAGLLAPHAGSVAVDGTPLKPGRASLASRAGIVLVPDNRSLFTGLTVQENLTVARHRGGPAPRDMLDVFPDLEKRWTLRAGALSGGEQQMLAMARALIQEPRVLLVDEMSMGLAPLIVERLFATVKRTATEHGCAVLLVEQHVSLALHVADTATVLNRGAIVLRGPAAELLADAERLEGAYFGAEPSEP